MPITLKQLKPKLKKVLRTKPRKFQAEGILFMEKGKGKILLGDDMGLGKTIQVLGYLAIHPEVSPVIIACPSNAKYGWQEQISQHTKKLSCEVLEGRKPHKTKAPILIINYDILPYWKKYLIRIRAKALILDECHYIKSRTTKRAKTCLKIAKTVQVWIPMSGTPITNRPEEFYTVLHMLKPKKFKSFWRYAMRYCDPKAGFRGRGWDFRGASNTDELHRKVSHFMIRRMKSEVLTELPKKQRIKIQVDITNRSEYNKAKTDFLSWYKNHTGITKTKKIEKMMYFIKIGQLKQLVALGKIYPAITWIDDYLSEDSNRKLVVFCHHKAVQRLLYNHYKKISARGGKSGAKRNLEVFKFQKNKRYRLFIASLKADRESITLTAANAVLFLELGWTPGEHDQAEDRINRIGQKQDSITAYYMLGKNTVDDSVWDKIQKKRGVVDTILDGKKTFSGFRKSIDITDVIKKLGDEK